MKSKSHDQLNPQTPFGVVEIYESHLKNYKEAIRRIDAEGQVVRDMRGAVVPHPSLSIQQTSADSMLVILNKHGLRPDIGIDDMI